MSLLGDAFGWGELDENFLNRLVRVAELDIADIKDGINEIGGNIEDINSWIYSALSLQKQNYFEKVKEFLENKGIEGVDLDSFEENIYTNYLDSGYDSILEEHIYNSSDDANILNFLNEAYESEMNDWRGFGVGDTVTLVAEDGEEVQDIVCSFDGEDVRTEKYGLWDIGCVKNTTEEDKPLSAYDTGDNNSETSKQR
jgi:hypothetical protein